MSRFAHFLPVTLLMISAVGCSRTYIADGQGTPSPDGQYRLAITSHGAYRHAYIDQTKKEVRISVWPARSSVQKPLFRERYFVVGSDVSWHTRWLSSTNVEVELFDYGDGVSSYDVSKTNAPTRQIRTIRLRVDRQAGTVREDNNAG
jgi:hypothetical protein